jgi:hypothetical protein
MFFVDGILRNTSRMRKPTSCLLDNYEQRWLRPSHTCLEGLRISSSVTIFATHAVWHRGLEPSSGGAAYTVAGPFTASKGAAQFLNSHSPQTLRYAEGTGVLSSAWQTVFQGSASVREGEEPQRGPVVGTIHFLNKVNRKSSSASTATCCSLRSFRSLQSYRCHCDNFVFCYSICSSVYC